MIEKNYFCDQPTCSQVAYVFGLGPQAAKSRACREHVYTLLDKRIPVFDIAAFEFISTAEDGPTFLQRREAVQKGLGNVSTLETSCDLELAEAQSQLRELQTSVLAEVEKTLHNWQAVTQKQHSQVRDRLNQVSANMNRFVLERNFELSTEEAGLCSQTDCAQPFKVEVVDCKGLVEAALRGHFQIHPHYSYRRGGSTKVKRGTSRLLLVLLFLIHLCFFGPQRPTVQEVSAEYVGISRTARETGNYELALMKLTEGKALLAELGMESPALYLQLGQVLERGLGLQLGLDSSSELALQLSNGIAEVYYEAGQWSEAAAASNRTLQVWGDSEYSTELLQALFILTDSQYWLRQFSQAFALVSYWKGKLLTNSPQSLCMLFLVLADKAFIEDLNEMAIVLYKEALELSRGWSQPSYILATAMRDLGYIYNQRSSLDLAEQLYSDASEILAVHYPYSLLYAHCLYGRGLIYEQLQRQPEAIPFIETALHVYAKNTQLELHTKCTVLLTRLRA